MSIKVSSLVWEFSHQKSGNRLVLLAIADHADEQGEAWPGISLLARKTSLCERHVRRCLNALQKAGEMEILPEASPHGGTLYRIRLENLTADNLSSQTPKSEKVTSASGAADVGVIPSIREPSEETSLETDTHSIPSKTLKCSFNPKLDEVLQFVSREKELDPEVAEIWWNECEAYGWIDSHSRAIVKWQPALIAYSRKWRANCYERRQPRSFGDSAEKKRARQPMRKPAELSSAPKNGF